MSKNNISCDKECFSTPISLKNTVNNSSQPGRSMVLVLLAGFYDSGGLARLRRDLDSWGEGRLVISQSNMPVQSRAAQNRLPQAISSWDVNSSRNGDSTTSLGNLCLCLTTLTAWKVFLMFKWNFLCVPCWAWLQPLYLLCTCLYTLIRFCHAGLMPPMLVFLLMGISHSSA